MLSDYTEYLPIIQIFIELNITFFVMDKTSFLFRFQHGIIDEVKDVYRDDIKNAEIALKKKNSCVDDAWLNKKAMLRQAVLICKYRHQEEYPENSLFWKSFAPSIATIAVVLCIFILNMFPALKNFEYEKVMNSILLTMQGSLVVVAILYRLYYTEKLARTSVLIIISFVWELIAIVIGCTLGFLGYNVHVIDTSMNPLIIAIIVWFPGLPFLIYTIKILSLLKRLNSDYRKLKEALCDFNNYCNTKC